MSTSDSTSDSGPADGSAREPIDVTAGQHEKVEGIDRIEDVVLPPEEPAAPAPVRGRFRKGPKQPKAEKSPRRRARLDISGGFRDPKRRPRFIVWTGVSVLLLAAVMIVALGVTSTRWFCAEACHKVQDDTIIAYEHSPHSEISCMACHMPVGANPVVFILHKAEALGELYLTVRDDYELPLNGESEVALTMKATQCTQCHELSKREVTPSKGIVIDHAVHDENEVACTICHNRTAHVEDFELTLTDPSTNKPNKPHENFMEMTACFRCHTQDKPVSPLVAPGDCRLCHTKGFQLKPESHLLQDFYPEMHGDLAKLEAARVESATAEVESESEGESSAEESVGLQLPKVETINVCYTCHAEKFCNDCHGAPMPHPEGFKANHAEYGKKSPESCANCHGDATTFCNECHHGTAMGATYNQSVTWLAQHYVTVAEVGASACFDCHNPTYCANCHVEGSASE
jgi:hypothetical protein